MKNRIFKFGMVATASILLANCSDNNNDPLTNDPNSALYTGILTDLSNDIITKTYEDLNTNALALKVAVNAVAIGNQASLDAVKEAWRATRAPWEKSEGFLYGPVDTGGIDPAMDTWPVNVIDMDLILDGTDPITAETVEANPETRGFHLIEYLVWGENGTKTANDLTAREIELMKAAAEDLQNNTQTLYDGWKKSGGNYGANFINAGQSGSIYTSQTTALEEIVDGIITISDEVANGKIADPLTTQTGGGQGVEVEESRFSNNSRLDFANNMRSIQNIYLGDYNGNSKRGLTTIVVTKNPALDAEIKAAITNAITAIEAIPVSFTDALSNNIGSIENAQEKVSDLKTVLETKLKPFITSN